MYIVKRFDKYSNLVEEIKFNFISHAIEYYLNNYDTVKIYDAHGTEIPEDMLPF